MMAIPQASEDKTVRYKDTTYTLPKSKPKPPRSTSNVEPHIAVSYLGYMCTFIILYLFFMNPCIHPCARIFPSGYMLMVSNESKQSRLIVLEKISTNSIGQETFDFILCI